MLTLRPVASWHSSSAGQLPGRAEDSEPKRADVIAALRLYDGPSAKGVDRSTLTGKVMCGYQGWFTAPGDGSGRGWRHYPAGGQFKPGSCGIDLWPDVSELDDDEKYPTPFRHSDGKVAQVFSSHNGKTVLRHFRWMQEYGIDGVFVQRFGVETLHPADLRHCNVVLDHCREGANRSGRCYAVMYDLSLLPEGGVRHVIEDWKLLVDRMKLGRDDKDRAYLRHGGKPVVAVWGIGFNDGRKYTLAECEKLVEFLKHDKQYGGCTVLRRRADRLAHARRRQRAGREAARGHRPGGHHQPVDGGPLQVPPGGRRSCRAAVEERPGVVPGAQEGVPAGGLPRL